MRSIMGWFATALIACAAVYQLWWADVQVGGSFLIDGDKEKSASLLEDLFTSLLIRRKGLVFFPVPRRANDTVPITVPRVQVDEVEIQLTSSDGYTTTSGQYTFFHLWKWTRLAMDCICVVYLGPDVVAPVACDTQNVKADVFCYRATRTYMSDYNYIYGAENGTLVGEVLLWAMCLLIALYLWFAAIVKVRHFWSRGLLRRTAAWFGCGCPWQRCRRRHKDAKERAAATITEVLRNEFRQRVASVLAVGMVVSMSSQVYSNLWYRFPGSPPAIWPDGVGPVVLVQGIALLPYVAGWARTSPRSYIMQFNIMASVSIMFYTVHQRVLYRENLNLQGSILLHVMTFMLRLFQVLLVGELNHSLAGQIAISVTRDLCGGFFLRPLLFGTPSSPFFLRDLEVVWLMTVVLVSSSMDVLFSGQAEAMVAVQFAELEMAMLKRSLVNISDAHCRLNSATEVDGEFEEMAFMLGRHVKALSGTVFGAFVDDDSASSFEAAIARLEQGARAGNSPSIDVYTTLKTAYGSKIHVRLHITCTMALEGCVYYIVVQEFGDDMRLATAAPGAQVLSSVDATIIGAASGQCMPRLISPSESIDSVSEDESDVSLVTVNQDFGDDNRRARVALGTEATASTRPSSAVASVIGATSGQREQSCTSIDSISEDAESVFSLGSQHLEGMDFGRVSLTVDVSSLEVTAIDSDNDWVRHKLRPGKTLDKILKDPQKFRKELDAGIDACASGGHVGLSTVHMSMRNKKAKVLVLLEDGRVCDFVPDGEKLSAIVSARMMAWSRMRL